MTTARQGTTLPEMLTVVVLLSLVLGMFLRALQRQQRFYATTGALLEQRGQLRQATAVIPAQLRSVSPAGGDLLALSDSALELRAHLGVGILCDTVPGRSAFLLAPEITRNGAVTAAYIDQPRDGDEVFVYDDGPTDAAIDDHWVALTMASVARTTAGCATSDVLDPLTDAGRPRLLVTLAAGQSLGPTVRTGAFVRITRRVRLRLYRSGTDWFLGYADWNGTGFTTVQPVTGPYRPYAPLGGPSGLAFRYLDSAGVALAAPDAGTAVARIEIVTRTALGARYRASDLTPGGATDSLAVTIAPRNRR